MFESMNAAQYRALSNEAFQKRFAEVKDLMSADTLPEGVTDEMLFEEAELIKADMERRSKRDAFAGMGVITINEAREIMQLPPLPITRRRSRRIS